MANEIYIGGQATGSTNWVAVRVRESDGYFWNTSGTPAFEAYNAANIANYAIAMTEVGATGIYRADDPAATTAGRCYITQRAGGSLAVTDLTNAQFVQALGPVQADVYAISGDATAADNLESAADGTGYNLGGGQVVAASVTGAVGSVTGNVGGNVTGSVDSVLGGINTTAGVITTLDALDTAQDLQHSTTQSATTTLTSRLTASRAGYLDNLNVGGNVASQADVNALNQSASRRVVLTTSPQFERPESGTVTYQIEARTYNGDGAAVNADSTPTLTATGIVTGDLSANLSVASNPATGVYRWTYTTSSTDTIEQARLDLSATISTDTFTVAAYTQIVDFVAATWSSTNAAQLTAIYDKLPSKTYLTGTANADGDVQIDESTGDFSATQQARIQTQAAAALTAYDPPTRTEATADKDEVLAELAAIQGVTFDTATDSLEAIRNRGDLSWVTATGFSTIDAAGVRSAVGLASANLDTQLGDIPTVAEFNARTLVASDYFDPTTDTVARVTLVDTCTTNTDMRGTDAAYTGTPPTASQIRTEIDSNSTQLSGIKAKTDQLTFTTPNSVDATASVDTAAIAADVIAGIAGVQVDLVDSPNPTAIEAIQSGLALSGSAMTLAADAVNADGYTLDQTLKLILAAVVGKLSGAGTDTEIFRAANDSKARITATVDESGNRSAITLDAS